jgi:hypothetical protein
MTRCLGMRAPKLPFTNMSADTEWDSDAVETVSVAQLQLVVQRIHDLQSELELKDRDLRLSAQLGQTVRTQTSAACFSAVHWL